MRFKIESVSLQSRGVINLIRLIEVFSLHLGKSDILKIKGVAILLVVYQGSLHLCLRSQERSLPVKTLTSKFIQQEWKRLGRGPYSIRAAYSAKRTSRLPTCAAQQSVNFSKVSDKLR
jgi:hypothetical protein